MNPAPDAITLALDSLPEALGWGMLITLVVRALVARLPAIIDSFSSAMAERAKAKRLAEEQRLAAQQTDLVEAQTISAVLERDAASKAVLEGHVRGLTARLAELEASMTEQARQLTAEIESANRATAAAAGALEQAKADADSERHRCDRAIAAIREEMERRISEMTSGHLTPAQRRPIT